MKPGVVFRGKGHVTSPERAEYDEGVDVYFQECAWMDHDVNMKWVSKTLIPGIGNSSDEKVIFADNVGFQLNKEFHEACRKKANAVVYLLPENHTVLPNGVAKQLAQLNPQKACWPDELPSRVLKEIAQAASEWLAFIFSQSFYLNVAPSDWSKSCISAVFKKKNKSDPSNCRPISLTSICCKVMEHIVLSHMAKHLSSNNILIDEQHGFRQQFSCETQLISAIHNWAKLINICSQTDVVLLDFSKAFDSVPHQRLLMKLH